MNPFDDALIASYGSAYINFGADTPLKYGGGNAMSLTATVLLSSLNSDAYIAHKYEVLNFGTIGGNRLYASLGGAAKNIQGKPDLVADTYYQVALVYDGTTLTIYREGKEDASGTDWPEGANTKPLLLGLDLATNTPVPGLTLSRIGIWNRALTPEEIQQIANS